MIKHDVDVVIVGAGASGLAALRELDRAGRKVLCFEARDHVGGRVLTVHDPLSPVSIELGAEFIHGRPPEIWDIVRSGRLTAYDCADKGVHLKDGKPKSRRDAWQEVDQVMSEMQEAASEGKDQTFAEFLMGSRGSDDAKRLATSYVEGFNAARQEEIGIASLAEDARAADEIDGDRSFRILSGYDAIVLHLLNAADVLATKLHLNCVVERIQWERGSATIHVRSSLTGALETVRAHCVLITVPLGVLQIPPDTPDSIRFDPEPAEVLDATRALRFGQVFRLVLRFREAFWENNRDISDAGFLFSDEQLFPTWWTTLPVRAPVLTAWSAGPHADELLGQNQAAVISAAIATLARITGSRTEHLNA
ncbi:MAG: FAD-dependent oxidoreductase, partial [Acidobacteria bacterium]|nr:FAD-dependent oxidoreductase [Acidobacteriota bacterium]